MAEILEFKKKIQEAETELEEYDDEEDEFELLSDAMLSSCLDVLNRAGYDIENKFYDVLPSIVLVKESIKSLQLKLKDIEHPLQEYAEFVFGPTENG
jgi:hypothetical protein